MPGQTFTEEDLDRVMADESVTILSGWTEPNTDEACDEAAYRRKLAENHAGYTQKIKEALESVAHSAASAG